ncbi:MAG TPA: BTAD domain-containing putative transcriptional regulator [Thermoanaerobaculia bacterium]|jgi:predicted ATPase/DNA-binding SARP family transcriptional activator|nr:BTAD domain-containing putative transcriptional regulator [Thermoanaerobaculia bacterium]
MSGPELPAPLTPLLGRARELEETERLLRGTRLLTITGAGGSGKTRLALELAHRVQAGFEDGVVWVELAPIDDPDLISQQILNGLGLREVAAADTTAVAIERLRDRDVLVVFDNCEHLVNACAVIAESILRLCPSAVLLATSREALGIGGEQTWLVPPLSQPDATKLFEERARAVAPAFSINTDNEETVARICRRLDGIPLAIELAAARVKMLSVEQVSQRLADAFRLLSSGSRTLPRHRTIRETIDWSYRLLSADEQTLLRRLAVFAGSFPLDAVEAVCGDVLDLLGTLVDKSLVMVDGERYRLLETVRQFAAEKLEQARERERFRERHARFYFDLIEAAEPRVFAGAVDMPTVLRIDHEVGNFRAVFDWAEEDPARSELELRLIYALHWYWFARGHFHEARRRIEEALARMTDVPPLVRARAYIAAGDAAVWQGDWGALRPRADEAVAILRNASDRRALGSALMLLGTAAAFADGDADQARRVFDEALSVARANGRDVALALTLYWAGLAAQIRGDLAAARAAFEEGYQIGADLDNMPAIGHTLAVLGFVALAEGKHGEAINAFRRALAVHAEIDDRWGLTQVVEGIGLALLDVGDAEVGTRLLAAAAAAWLQLGARPGRQAEFEREKDERIHQALGNDRLRVVLASGAALPYDEMVAIARQHVAGALQPAQRASERPSLEVLALGPLEIWRDGRLLEAATQSGRSRELLLYLLSHPRGCTKEQIGAALWPEVDPARLRNNFHVTLHRLRKAIGSDWVVTQGETYAIERKGLEYDVETFEKEARSKEPEKVAHAIELYRGDFFANATAEWLDDLRDRLRDLYANALTTLARTRVTAGDHAAAAEVFRRIVDMDDLAEDAARGLMTALAKSGDAAGAQRAYRRLADALRRELETEPEPLTSRLAQKIANGEVG